MKVTGVITAVSVLMAAAIVAGCSKTASESTAGSDAGNKEYLQTKVTCTGISEWVQSYTVNYVYDSKNNLFMSAVYDTDEKLTSYETDYTYDDNGNELVHVQYNADGKATGFVSREYDENQKVKKYTVYTNSGEILNETSYQYTYDDNGSMIRMSCFDYEDKLVQENEYNNNGKVIKEIYYQDNNDTVTYEYEYEYDAAGNNIITSIYVTYSSNSLRELDSRNEMTYDQHNNMVKLVHSDSEGKTDFYYEFEYKEAS